MTEKKSKDQIPTTGHVWDGIEELDTPMPRWWLWTFYATIIWGILYTIFYPAWPMISKATPGLLGYSTRAELAAQISIVEEAKADINGRIITTDIREIRKNQELDLYARNTGAAIFKTWCAQCHGSGAAGVQAAGYPNLIDNDWLWGGSVEEILYTINHGIRSEADEDTRISEMPAFGEVLSGQEIKMVVNYVMSMTGEPKDVNLVSEGQIIFEDNCSICHGEGGKGDRELGVPHIADAIWLYGGDYDRLIDTVTIGRSGVMPSWKTRLSEAEILSTAIYVHSLGGGESPTDSVHDVPSTTD